MNKLTIFIMMLIALCGSSFAVPMPAPVVGDVLVNGVAVDGYTIKVENINTGEIIDGRDFPSLVTEDGKFMFDLGDFTQGYNIRYNLNPGDTIKISVCDFDSECYYEFEVADTSPKFLKFIIDSSNAPSGCPVIDCPSVIWAVLITLIGAGSIGVGIKVYKGRTGETKLQHIHPGVSGYHDPNTVHKNLNIRHPKGEKVPNYIKGSDGVWYYKK